MKNRFPLPGPSPVKDPADCWSWLAPERVATLAALAHDMAAKGCDPIFWEGELAWSDRETFFSNLVDNFGLLLCREAESAGVETPADVGSDLGRLDALLRDYRESGGVL